MKNFKVDKNSVFHRFLICPNKLQKNNKEVRRGQDLTTTGNDYGSTTGSTIHLCRLIHLQDQNISNWPLCIMKRVGFTDKEIKRGANTYASTSHIRKIEQIRTQFLVFNLLANSKRCIKLYDLLTENPRRNEDQSFFYKYLGVKKIEGINNACLFIEYCNGGDLERMIEKMDRPFNSSEVINYACQILQGLNQLKKKGVLHRDLRPCNIFIHNGQIKFADFDSAYIYKLSNLSDVSNGIDIDTTPPEIVELASKTEQQLKLLGSEKIYNLQSKCDIYFFGMIIFKMIFQKNYYKTYQGATLDYLIKDKISNGYNQHLLEIMKQCLHWSVQKRIDLKSLNVAFTEIQINNYFNSENNEHKCYLSADPLALFETPEFQFSKEQNEQQRQKYDQISYLEKQNEFKVGFEKSYTSRYSEIYKTKLGQHIGQDKQKKYSQENLHVWNLNLSQETKKKYFFDMTEQFLKNLTMKGFYYDYLYKVILRIDIRALKNKDQKLIMKENKVRLQRDLVTALMFIFQILSRTPFKIDKYYQDYNFSYEMRKLFENLVKINNKAAFFESRTRILECQSSQLFQIIKSFYEKQYTESEQDSFQPVKIACEQVISKIEKKIKEMLIETSLDLIKSYENKHNEKTNLRQILLVLIIFCQHNQKSLQKHSLVTLKNSTQALIYREKVVNEQIEVFFSQFKKFHVQAQKKSEQKLNSHSNINTYKYFLPQLPSTKITGPLQGDINYGYSVKINGN